MVKLGAAILAMVLCLAAAPALAGEQAHRTHLVIPVVNLTGELAVMTLDGQSKLPGHRYLEAGRALTLEVEDLAQLGWRQEHEHILDFSLVSHGIEPWCRVKVSTANTAGRRGGLLTYCLAAASDERCVLRVYSEAQVCWVLVEIR